MKFKKIINYKENHFILILLIFTFNLLIHSIPFIRYSISSDDFAQLEKNYIGLSNILLFTERPLQYLFIELQNFIVGDDYILGSFLIFLSNLLIIFFVYFLFYFLLDKRKSLTFILCVFYSLYFSKVEIFHYPIFLHINVVTSIYLFSILTFILFLSKKEKKYLIFSNISYFIAIFWYEIGFFLPFLYFLLIIKKNINLKNIIFYILPFLVIILFYLSFRFTHGFGMGDQSVMRSINFNILNGVIDSFHNLFGRSFIKNVTYGFYSFVKYNLLIVSILLFLNIFFVIISLKLIKKIEYYKLDYHTHLIFLFIIILTLIPNILVGSTGGRSLIIASVGVSYFVYLIISYFKINYIIISILILLSMIINQGNNFNQIIASKISHSFFETIKENKDNINVSDFIIYDMHSFKKHIKHALITNNLNNFNYYYGAQIFEDWGLKSMIRIATNTNYNKDNIFIASTKVIKKNNQYFFNVSSDYSESSYRKKINKEITLLNQNVFIIDYDLVYKNGFKNGFN